MQTWNYLYLNENKKQGRKTSIVNIYEADFETLGLQL